MKNDPILMVLKVGVCILGAVCLLLAVVLEYHFRTLRGLQPLVGKAQTYQNYVNSLANEALEYSQHNPAIDPILAPVGVKAMPPRSATPAANKPAGK